MKVKKIWQNKQRKQKNNMKIFLQTPDLEINLVIVKKTPKSMMEIEKFREMINGQELISWKLQLLKKGKTLSTLLYVQEWG